MCLSFTVLIKRKQYKYNQIKWVKYNYFTPCNRRKLSKGKLIRPFT